MRPGEESYPIGISKRWISLIRAHGSPAQNVALNLYLEALYEDAQIRKSDAVVQEYLGTMRLCYTY